MTCKTIEKTDNFRVVLFDPSPTAGDLQELYEKGWVLHMGPFAVQGGKFHTAMFFRAAVPTPAMLGLAVKAPEVEMVGCQHSWTEESSSNNWRAHCRHCGKEATGSGQ